MGVVYTPEQIRANAVPQPGAHQEAALFVLDELVTTSEWGEELREYRPQYNGIVAAMAYGSTTTGKSTPRSDVDMLIVYERTHYDFAYRQIGQAARQSYERYGVIIEPNILPVSALRNPDMHDMDPLFIDHLLEVNQDPQWSRNDPASQLAKLAVNPYDIARVGPIALKYASKKAHKFGSALAVAPEQLDCKLLQRAFEFPMAMGRKALPATRRPGESLPHISKKAETKRQVRDKLGELASANFPMAVRDTDFLEDKDQAYSELLQATVHEEVSPDEYGQWLQDVYPEVIKRAARLSTAWCEVVEYSIDSQVGSTPMIPPRYSRR